MQLKPIDSSSLIHLVAGWLSEERNARWLDFGSGQRIVRVPALKLMTQREIHLLRVFTPDSEDLPIGIVALSNIDRSFKTAVLWFVLGDKRYAGQGYTARAAWRLLTAGFEQAGLHAIHAWTVECNAPSLRILNRLNFRSIGRQRECHVIEGRAYDRLWFDLLDSEHRSSQPRPLPAATATILQMSGLLSEFTPLL